VREFLKEVEISEERIGLDVMKAVGPGHHFLATRHTKYMRDELTLLDKKKLDMLSKDRADLVAEAKEIAKQLLKDHRVLPVDEGLVRQGNEIIKGYEERVGRG
jgi:trimethylamine:corrinoid methyltransferase-like protein